MVKATVEINNKLHSIDLLLITVVQLPIMEAMTIFELSISFSYSYL